MDLEHLRASDGTGEAILAHVQSVRTIGSTVLDLDNIDNWNAKCIVVTGTPNANGYIDSSGMTVMYGHTNAGDFIIDGYAPGYADAGNTTTQVAIVKMTTSWADALVDILELAHGLDGSIKPSAPLDGGGTLVGGWFSPQETWTYSSYNSTTRTGVVTVPTDATTKYVKGMRVKFTQSTGGTKYGIIHDVTATTLHIFMQSGKTIANESITDPFYSMINAFGFPRGESNWGLELTSTAQQSQVGASAATWYNVGSNSLAISRGIWRVQTRIGYQFNPNPAAAGAVWYCTVSNANNTEWNADLTEHFELGMTSATAAGLAATHDIDKEIEVSADTTLYINLKCNVSGNLYVRGELVRTKLRVVSAYL